MDETQVLICKALVRSEQSKFNNPELTNSNTVSEGFSENIRIKGFFRCSGFFIFLGN